MEGRGHMQLILSRQETWLLVPQFASPCFRTLQIQLISVLSSIAKTFNLKSWSLTFVIRIHLGFTRWIRIGIVPSRLFHPVDLLFQSFVSASLRLLRTCQATFARIFDQQATSTTQINPFSGQRIASLLYASA